MNCESVSSRLSSYLDGELTGHEMLSIRSHLGKCSKCHVELAELRAAQMLVRSLETPEPSEFLEARILEAVFAPSKPKRHFKPVHAFAVATAAGFALVLLQGALSQTAPAKAEAKNKPAFDVRRDQAYFLGSEPMLNGNTVIPASYEQR